MADKQVRNDLKCFNCHKNESFYLIYFQKMYRDVRRYGFYNPMLLCKDCIESIRESDRLFERQPVIKTFLELGKMDMKLVMYLCSHKNKEHNDIADKAWKTRLIAIKKLYEGKIKSWTIQSPMPI